MRIAVGHANPDFDAYAATVAAVKRYPGSKGVYLGSQNRNVREFHNLHQDFLDFVDLRGLDLDAIETLVMVDTRDPERIGELGPVALRSGVEVIVYDHHPAAEGDVQGAEDHSRETGATTSILVNELVQQGVSLSPLEATVMLLGIHEDTGSLTYPNTTPLDAEAVMYLLEAGADLEVVTQFLSHTLTVDQRALLDRLLAGLEKWDVNGQEVAIAFASIPEYVDSASVVTHYLCEDMGYRVVIAAIEMPDRLYVVARSRIAEVDVAAILGHVGGGGHSQAASAALARAESEGIRERLREALHSEVSSPLTAVDIGTSPVRTVGPATTMREAADLMQRWGHGGLPVVEGGRIVGLVTRKDVDKASRHGLEHAPVKGFMGHDVITVPPDTDLESLERLMTRESIGRVPVVTGGRPISIVTRKDLLRAKHGAGYLDRRARGGSPEASVAFLRGLHEVLPPDHRRALEDLGRLADQMGLTAHVVGGFVRDMLLGRENLDVDIVVEGDGIEYAEAAAERLGGRIVVHRRFGTAILVLSPTMHADIASARTEYYARPGALPTVEASSLRQDLLRRDFSINAMAACINPGCFGVVSDPFGGLRDLEKHRIRVLHAMSFVEDPTRVFRAARFEQRYGFEIEPATEALARQCVEMGMLDDVSGARIRAELFEILREEDVVAPLARLAEFGALAHVAADALPEGALEEIASVQRAAGELADTLPGGFAREHAIALALVAHAERHEAERWARWLRLARVHREAAGLLAERRDSLLHTLAGGAEIPASRLHHMLAPFTNEAIVYLYAVARGRARARVEKYARELVHVKAAVSGEDLVALGLTPGPEFSAILDRALDDRLDGVAVGRAAELAHLADIVKGHPASAD